MFAICIESSHARGMGHLFRAMHLARVIEKLGESPFILLNDYSPALQILARSGIPHGVVDLSNADTDWEGRFIRMHGVRTWINDRLDTTAGHAAKVKERSIPLVTFDDRGAGAAMADLHIAALAFDPKERLGGTRVLRGVEYLVLDPQIARYRRLRTSGLRTLVTMGGTDTYGLTATVVQLLREAGRVATVVTGPGYRHHLELTAAAGDYFKVKQAVPSLVAEFMEFDVAITAGGITPFEANASGLPCIVVASELFEIPVGRELERLGGSVFAGHHSSLDVRLLTSELPVTSMSRAGIARIRLDGAERIVKELTAL